MSASQHRVRTEQGISPDNDRYTDADDDVSSDGNAVAPDNDEYHPPVEIKESEYSQHSTRWKGKNKAISPTELLYYSGGSRSDLEGFIKYCELERPHGVDCERLDFAVEHLKGVPASKWYHHKRENFGLEYTWQDFVRVLEDALTDETITSDYTNESLTTFHSNGISSNSATVKQSTDPYDIVDFLAVMQDRLIDIVPIKWEEELDVGLGGTAKILQGGSAETSEGLQLNFVFKRVHRENSKEVDRCKEYRALLSEVYILGHPVVRHHPNIISLEAVCWDTVHDEAWPVLVFKRSPYGDLSQFMHSDEGMKLDFNARVKLCREIGNAILLMHSCHAVHGDLKPENVLIFKDVNGQYSAQVADFGYSTLFAEDSESADVYLPLSFPWTAPEIENCTHVTFKQAKYADIFSFGLLCFWLLCYENLPRRQSGSQRSPNPHAMWEMKMKKDFTSIVFAEVSSNMGESFDLAKGMALRMFFDDSLSNVKEERKLHLDCLSVPFDYIREPLPLIEEYGRSVSRISQSIFNLAGMFSQLSKCSKKTWETIFKCLEGRTNSHVDDAARKLAAYQLAFCYEVGFGVAVDKDKAQFWMDQGGWPQEDLKDAIDMIKEDANSIFQNTLAHIHVDYFDHERPPIPSIGGAEPESDITVAASNDAIKQPSPADISRLASTVAWIYQSMGVKVGEVRMSIVPEGEDEEETEKKLAQASKDQFGWDSVGDTTKIELSFNEDDLFNAVPIQRSWESIDVAANTATPEDKEKRLLRSKDRKLKVLGPEHVETLRSMDALSQFYGKHGKLEEAEALEIHVLQVRRERLGQQHPTTLRTMEKLAGLCMLRQGWEEAENFLLEVLDTRKKVLGSKHPDAVKCLEYLDYLVSQYTQNDMLEAAATLQKQILEFRRKAIGDDDEMTLHTMRNLGIFYMADSIKMYTEAEELFGKIVDMRQKLHGNDDSRTLEAMQLLAGAYGMRCDDPDKLNKMHRLQVKIQNSKAMSSRTEATIPSGSAAMNIIKQPCEHVKGFSESVNSMGQFVWSFFDQNLDRTQLDKEINEAERHFNELRDDSPDRSKTLARLATAFLHRFHQHNAPEDLDSALIWAEQAMIILPEDHREKASSLEELSNIFWIRYKLTNSPDDLASSLKYAEESVTSTTPDDQNLAVRMGSLADRFRKKYGQTDDGEALDLAILWGEQAVEAVVDDDPRLLWRLSLWAQWLTERYHISHTLDDLDGAIDAFDRAEVLDMDDGMRAQLHDEQSSLYEERFFEHSHEPEDLNKSIRKSEKSVDAASRIQDNGPTLFGGEAAYGPLLSMLAFRYFTRFKLMGFPEDLDNAVSSIDKAAEIVPAESRHRERVMSVRGLVRAAQHEASSRIMSLED